MGKITQIEVIGLPQQKGSKTAFMAGTHAALRDTNANKAKAWQQAVRDAAAAVHDGPLMTGPVRLSVAFRFPRPASHYGTGRNSGCLKPSAPRRHAQTPDLDKLLRTLQDGLEGVVIRNDSQICEYGVVCRRWTENAAGATVIVDEIE